MNFLFGARPIFRGDLLVSGSVYCIYNYILVLFQPSVSMQIFFHILYIWPNLAAELQNPKTCSWYPFLCGVTRPNNIFELKLKMMSLGLFPVSPRTWPDIHLPRHAWWSPMPSSLELRCRRIWRTPMATPYFYRFEGRFGGFVHCREKRRLRGTLRM